MKDEKKELEKASKLDLWKERLKKADTAYADEVGKMDHREELFRGTNKLKPMVTQDKGGETTCHVRNIVFENIESQVSSSYPKPLVVARRKKDEPLAEKIEHFIRCEMERLPFDQLNDLGERTVPIQGGVGWNIEWDNTVRTHKTVGAVDISLVHPKQFAPQPGITTGIEDMDWFIIKEPTTKDAIFRQYGKSIYNEGEAEPELRGIGEEDHSDDTVTKYIGYAKGEAGGIDKFVWVNDVVLEDLEDYQARRVPVCSKCGRVKPLHGQVIQNAPAVAPESEEISDPVAARIMALQLAQLEGTGESALEAMDVVPEEEPAEVYEGGPCPWCGCEEFTDEVQKYEQVMLPLDTTSGVHIPGNQIGMDEEGKAVLRPTQIPFYKPDVYPILLQRSVSVFGQLLGNSDVDAIEDQQNTINRLEKKIIDRLLKAGTRVTLPDRADFDINPKDGEVWRVSKPAEMQLIHVFEFKGELQYELNYLSMVYEESRQILGITDSFQGRRDPTATSGIAKEYSAQRSAGRMESKRIMKNAAYEKIFELIFKNWLAYSDEPRPISYKDFEGQTQYDEISRYDFLEQDADGQYYWNDQFLFTCDTSSPLAGNREALWQETRMNLQTGAFGDPAATDTLILFWGKMADLHYPGAADTKKYLEDRKKQEQAEKMQMMRLQMELQKANMGAGTTVPA